MTHYNITQPLDRGFNIAVRHIADRLFPKGFDVSDDAPDTLDKLKAHIESTGRMCVWSGGSDQTIFDDAETNYAFRAWHDYYHWKHDLPFTSDGETAVLLKQQTDILTLYGHCPNAHKWCRMLTAEVEGQLQHQECHGEFPTNQRGFVEAYMQSPHAALERAW